MHENTDRSISNQVLINWDLTMTTMFYIFLLIILLCILLIYIAMGKIKDRSVYLRNVPGPDPFFIFGNTLEVIQGSTVFLDKVTNFLNTYGDTILLHDGAFSWFVTTIDYDFMALIFNSLVYTEKSVHYKYFHSWLGLGLLTSSGSHWKSHRKAITYSFHFSVLQKFLTIFNYYGENLIRKLQSYVDKDSVEILKIISLFTHDVICDAAMGVKINALDNENSEYIKSVKAICAIITERTYSPFNSIIYPLTPNYYREKKALRIINSHVGEVINKRLAEHKKDKLLDLNDAEENEVGTKKRFRFLDMLLKSTINGRPFSKQELLDEVNTFMFEGHDTTATAITFCLLMLAKHPDIQEKVFKEQQEMFGMDLMDVRPTYDELHQMKYLDLVIKESLRLFPPVPYFGRKLTTDLEYKGTLYPKGLDIMLSPYIVQRNPKYFSQPDSFIPERFKDAQTKLPFSYAPFSAGPRNCIGQKFAMLEMYFTVSKIIRHYKLGPARPEHQIQLAAEQILTSKNGVRISLKNRLY